MFQNSAGRSKQQQCDELKVSSMTAELGANQATNTAVGLKILGGQTAAVLSGIAYAAKYAFDWLTSSELNCDDIPLDDIKEILGKSFTRVDSSVDRNFDAVRQNLREIKANYQAIKQIESKVDVTLRTIVQRFDRVDDRFQEVQDGMKELQNLVVELKIQDNASDLLTFIDKFIGDKEGLKNVSHRRRLALLQGENGYLNYFKTQALTLHLYLNKILTGRHARPKDANDTSKLMALSLLYVGTNTYIDVFQFLLDGYKYLGQQSYDESNVDAYNAYYTERGNVVVQFRNALCGIRSQTGLISKVISELDDIKKLDFIKNGKSGIYSILTEEISYLEKINAKLWEMNEYRNHEQALLRISYDFTNSTIQTPFLRWKNGTEVRYAVHNSVDSLISHWSEPHFTVDKNACPRITLHGTPSAKKVIFRKFDDKKPQLAGVVNDQTEFRDIDRDLFDAVLEGNEQLARTNTGVLIQNGANVTASFEGGKQAIHAATIAGHLEIISTLMRNGADINAQDWRGYTPLHTAAEVGHKKVVKALIEEGAIVGALSHLNWTALHVAAENGHVEILKVLSQADKTDLNAKAVGGFTPLHLAVNNRKKKAVEELVFNERADVNAQSDKLVSPLQLAVLNQDTETMQTLLDNNVTDVNIATQGGLTALHLATTGGDAAIVEQLLRHNATELNSKSVDDWTPLHLALMLRSEYGTETLMNASRIDVNSQGKDKITPLHLASRTGQTSKARELLNRGAELEAKDAHGFTPLHCAAENGQLDTVRFLVLEKGAYLNATENRGYTPLGLSVLNNNIDTIEFLLDNNANVNAQNNNGVSLIEDAVLSCEVRTVKILVKKGAILGLDVLEQAASKERWEMVKYLLFEKSSAKNGETPLHSASKLGDLGVLTFVFQTVNNVNARDKSGETPLHYAVHSGNVKIVEYLIQNGAQINAAGENKKTALHYAALEGKLEIVRLLVGRGADIFARGKLGQIPLYTAAYVGQLSIVKFLRESGSIVNTKTNDGWTPLHAAAEQNHLDTVKYLLENGSMINAVNNNNLTPLHSAAIYGKPEIVRYLIQKGSNVNATEHEGETPLHEAARAGKLDNVRVLVEMRCNPFARNNFGQTALFLAAQSGQAGVVKFLKENGSDVNTRDNNGFTPLHVAAQKNLLDTVKCLVENGAIVNARTNFNYTPLHTAAIHGALETLKYLTEKGSNIKAKDNGGKTAKQRAEENGQVSIVRYFTYRRPPRRRRARSINPSSFRQIEEQGLGAQIVTPSPFYSQHDRVSSSLRLKLYSPDQGARLNAKRVSLMEGSSSNGATGEGNAASSGGLFNNYSSSLSENAILIKWLLHLFGRKSLVKKMNEVEQTFTTGERQNDADWAERHLLQGIAHYGRRQ